MNEEMYLLFDRYLQNEMTAEEKNVFENQLADDKLLASSFETFKETQIQLSVKFGIAEEREAFKANLKNISEAHFNSDKPKVVVFRPWYLAVAASIAVLFGLFFFNYNQNPVFEDYNNPEQASFAMRGSVDEILKLAEENYNAKKYDKAIPFFETVLEKEKTSEIYFFYGVSLLEESNYSKAEKIFNQLKSGTSVYKEKAVWYLALSKLKQKDYKACKQILLTISEDYENYEDVQDLLNALE